MERSFWEILEEKALGSKPQTRHQSTIESTPFQSSEEPSVPGFSWLLSTEKVRSFPRKSAAHRTYGVTKKAPQPRQIPKVTLPAHLFNETQKRAFLCLKRHAEELSEAFNLEELKRAWKQTALKTHPDRGGNAEDFREALACYSCLQRMLT